MIIQKCAFFSDQNNQHSGGSEKRGNEDDAAFPLNHKKRTKPCVLKRICLMNTFFSVHLKREGGKSCCRATSVVVCPATVPIKSVAVQSSKLVKKKI